MILIIGSNGQLGKQMQIELTKRGELFTAYDYPDIDITNQTSMRELIYNIKPDTVVNCAAYTNVDTAEDDYDNAYKINAVGPKMLAEICNEKKIDLFHISTDYVFNGQAIIENGYPRPYIESDKCDPQTAYGETKLAGERFVQSCHDKYYLLRTAWLYGDGNNFVRTMLKLADRNDTVRVVDDQIGSPTSTVDLAHAICSLIGSEAYGLYHATCEGFCSWYDFARMIFMLKSYKTKVIPTTSEEFASSRSAKTAKRPAWSVLENAQLKQINRNVFRTWETSLKEYLENS